MGFIHDTFGESVTELWNVAKEIKDKPIHPDITWTYGFLKGKGHDYLDLQTHALALASSVIITEPVVPKIICCWDTPVCRISSRRSGQQDRDEYYPKYMLSQMGVPEEEFHTTQTEKLFRRDTKYFSLVRSSRSVNTYSFRLGIGYRAKYLGLEYVKTPYGIMTDTDTICLRPCVEFLMDEVNKNPDSFCWSAFWEPENVQLNVGLNVYNMSLYHSIYQPYFNEMYWDLPKQDGYFFGTVLKRYPELVDKLPVELLDYEKVSTGKYKGYNMAGGKTTWNDDKTMHYHGWKGEYRTRRNKQGFIDTFNNILDTLKNNA